jgi:predicted aspartyl protease
MRRLFCLWVFGVFPVLALAGSDPSNAVNVSLVRRDTGTYYLPGEIRGYGEIQFLLDTGSSYMVVGESILSRLKTLGAAVFSREIHGVMADGRPRVVPLYRIAALRLGQNCWVHDVEVAVLEDGTRAILGMDVLSRLAPFTFSAQPPQLGLSGCRPDAGAPELADAAGAPVPTPSAAAR